MEKKQAQGSDDVSLIVVLACNCVPMRMKRADAYAWIKDFAAGNRYKHYDCGTAVVEGRYVKGMFIQELPYDQRRAAELQEELLRQSVERERRERGFLGQDDNEAEE